MLLLYEERPLSEQGARFTPPTYFPKKNLWRQRRTFLVGRSLRRIFPVCGNSSSDIQRLRHLPPMSSPASTQVWCRLCPPWENWPSWLEALEDGRGAPDTAPDELVGAPDTILAERSRWLEGSQGLRAPSLKLPIRHQQTTPTQSMPHGAERGVGSGPESNVVASLGEALAALLRRAIRQPGSGCEVSAATASSVEELEKIGLSGDGSRLGAGQLERLKLTRESNPSLVIRAHERETQRDLGSYHRHARDKVLPAASGHPVLRTTIVILSRALDLLRGATPAQAQAFLSQAKRPRPRRATRTSSGRNDGRSWGSTTRMVLSARATRRRNTQLWRPSIATWSSWTSTCRGRSRAEAAPRKTQALQMPLEETQEPNAMPTCGPSWTRRRRTWPPFARREQARRLSLGKPRQCPPTIFSLAGGPFCTSNFSGVAEPRAPVFAREAAIGADRWLFDWARLSWSRRFDLSFAMGAPLLGDTLITPGRRVWKQRGQRAAWIPPDAAS